MTSEALITAATLSPTLRPRSSTASFVMDDVTVTPWPRSTTTCAVVAPLWNSTTLPLSWLRALSFIMIVVSPAICMASNGGHWLIHPFGPHRLRQHRPRQDRAPGGDTRPGIDLRRGAVSWYVVSACLASRRTDQQKPVPACRHRRDRRGQRRRRCPYPGRRAGDRALPCDREPYALLGKQRISGSWQVDPPQTKSARVNGWVVRFE